MLSRLETMVLMGMDLPLPAIQRQIASGLDIIVHLGRLRDKTRKGKKRYAYEEMIQTCHEMDSGVTESESYENFGRRCDVQVYIRLGALLSQNLRKGTKGLTELLKLESIQAFEERKAQAKRLGEEAGTKLLLPMFLMLAVVLVIVIVPAFLTLQI